MSSSAVADRYARALFELALEANQVQSVTQQLRRAAEVYASSAELRDVLSDPIFDERERNGVIRAVGERLALDTMVQNTLRVLVERRRIGAVGEIAARLAELADEQAGVIKATVASAQPLSDGQFEAIKRELERLTGCKVAVERQQDPSLLAGVVARVGDHVIDASLRGRLAELGQKLLENPT